MARLIQQPFFLQAGSFSSGTWTYTAPTASEIGYWGRSAADASPVIRIGFQAPWEVQQYGSKLTAIEVPLWVGTADLDAVLAGALYMYPTHRATPVPVQTFTANADTNLITLASGYFELGQLVTLTTSGTLPGGLATSTNYYLGNLSGTNNVTCQLFTTLAAAKLGSDPVDITSAGSGTHTMTAADVGAGASTLTITEAGTQVTARSQWRNYIATVSSPVYPSSDYTGLPVSYGFTLTADCAATTILRVGDNPRAIWEVIEN